MDIVKALRELHDEKKRLDAAIASLEARSKAARTGSVIKPAKGRRGRQNMSAAERLEVSKRMKLYWEARRTQSPALQNNDDPSHGEDQQASTTSAS
jgi:hypothetical protein